MTTAIVLGGALGVWQEMEYALKLAGTGFDIVVAVNHAGIDYGHRLDHWATYHPELLPRWAEKRRAKQLPDAGSYWTVEGRRAEGLALNAVPKRGGSSGFIGAQVAMAVGATRIVLCGIPMDAGAEHYDKRGAWTEADKHRQAWRENAKAMDGIVKSMSGWSAELLGRPSRGWLIQ